MKIHPCLLEFGDWPCTHTDAINQEPGVYVILGKVHESDLRYETLYIGSSKNLRKRLNGHEILKKFSTLFMLRVHFLYTHKYRDYEIAMIEKHRPLANIQHNPDAIYG